MTVQLSEAHTDRIKDFLKSPRRPVEGTQKHRVLTALEAAGPEGVLSVTFIEQFMPRVASRIWELKQDGWNIISKPEGEFARYFLVGHDG